MSKRVLVTGATGFTGGALARKLTERGDEVVALVRKTANIDALKELGATIVYGDITDLTTKRSTSAVYNMLLTRLNCIMSLALCTAQQLVFMAT